MIIRSQFKIRKRYGVLELIILVHEKNLKSYISTYFIYGFTSVEALLLKIHACTYRISSNKTRGYYFFVVSSTVGIIRNYSISPI